MPLVSKYGRARSDDYARMDSHRLELSFATLATSGRHRGGSGHLVATWAQPLGPSQVVYVVYPCQRWPQVPWTFVMTPRDLQGSK